MKKEKTIKAYKGFNSDMTCRGFQYEVGKEYEQGDDVHICEKGFHAISEYVSPLLMFNYYPPADNGNLSRYCEVEMGGKTEKNSDKICSSKITIGAEIGIPGLVKAHVEWVKKNITNDNNENSGAATAGDSGAATAGSYGAATAGDRGAATAGDRGAATAGDSGAATAGDSGAATAGYSGAATSKGSSAVGENGVAVARGNEVKVKGGIGALLVIAVENDSDYYIKEWKAVVVDGYRIKADTWYKLENGEFTEVK